MRGCLVTICLLPVVGWAELPAWMGRHNPGELGLIVSMARECGINNAALRYEISKEFKRAGVRPLAPADSRFFLTISGRCLPLGNWAGARPNSLIVATVVQFGKPDSRGRPMAYWQHDYGALSVGSNDEQRIVEAIKTSVKSALSDYVTTNAQSIR